MKTTTAPDFETLVNSYFRTLLRFAVSLCGDLESALELTERAFLVAIQRREPLGKRRQAKRWLFTILFAEFLRRRQLQKIQAAK
jgi:DNA-directed RNA polymerase specialized sigma24 family protein